jgi:lambda family phage tail tape measure protein
VARTKHTYAIRLAVEGGGQVKAELVSVGQSGEQSLKRIEAAGERASGGLKGLGRQAELLRTGIRTLGGALLGVTTVAGLTALVDRSISAADAIGKTADKTSIGVEALQELRFAEIEALRAKDGSNAQNVDQLITQSAAVRDAQLAQLRAKKVEAAEKVRAANERVVASLEAERAALTQTERERFVAQALSRLSAEATAEQGREVERLAGALFDEQQALQARQRLMDEGRSVVDRTRNTTEQYATEIAKLNELLAAGAIDLEAYARAVEDANDQLLRSSQEWTDGATRFLKDYVAESQDAAAATEQAFASAFGGAEDALVGFATTGRLELKSLADTILADVSRLAVRQSITGPLAGLLQGGFAGGGLFGLFHEGGIAGEPSALRYADSALFDHATRYHGGGFAGAGLLPDEVPIIARRGELVVPPERVVREERTARAQRPITVVVNVTAADASSFRASQGQIGADMARAIDRASRNRRAELNSAAPWRRSRCCHGDYRSCCSEAFARGRAAWCAAAGGAAAAWRRCGCAFGRPHMLRRPHAKRADRRAGWHSVAGCSCCVPHRQSYARAGRRARAARRLRFSTDR